MNYSEKLKDPRWQKRRLKVMEYARWRCQICGAKDNTLHCHHSYYSKAKEPWQYPEGSIICICDACHAKIHDKPRARPAPTAFPPLPAKEVVTRFAEIRAALASTPKTL